MLRTLAIGAAAILLPLPLYGQDVPPAAREKLAEDLAEAQQEINTFVRMYMREMQQSQQTPLSREKTDQEEQQYPLFGQEQEEEPVREPQRSLARWLMDSVTSTVSQLREEYVKNPYYRITGFTVSLGITPSVDVVFEFVVSE